MSFRSSEIQASLLTDRFHPSKRDSKTSVGIFFLFIIQRSRSDSLLLFLLICLAGPGEGKRLRFNDFSSSWLECPTSNLKTWKLEPELEISSSSQVKFNYYQFQVFKFKTWRTWKFQVKSSQVWKVTNLTWLESWKWESFFNHRSICNQTSHKTWWWYIKLSCFLKSFL